MKVAISVTGKGGKANMEPRFGRCPYFAIAETTTNEIRFMDNPGRQASGGAGVAAVQALADEGVELIVSGRFGPKVSAALAKSGIKTQTAENQTVDQILKSLSGGGDDEQDFGTSRGCALKHGW